MPKTPAQNTKKTSLSGLILIWVPLILVACGGQEQFSALKAVNGSEEKTLEILTEANTSNQETSEKSENSPVSGFNSMADQDDQIQLIDSSPSTKENTTVTDSLNSSNTNNKSSNSDSPVISEPLTPTPIATNSEKEATDSKKSTNPYSDISKKYPYPTYKMEALSWENEKNPERTQWSKFLQEILVTDWASLLEGSRDIKDFCPNFYKLNIPQRANVWAQIFSVVSLHESSYVPTRRMHEKTMGTDPVTKKPVYSEGLLQLSYQDTQWATHCKFDWKADQHLDPKDSSKTILNPYRNLYCGVGIMANQIKKRKDIALVTGVYWAVLKEGGRYTKIPEITKQVKAFKLCK